MEKNTDEFYLARCLNRISGQFGRGPSSEWSTYDFEKLSTAIHERTEVSLSVTTLKRLWGRLKYDSAPTLTTLNALAQFAGFTDWTDFKQNEESARVTKEPETAAPPRRERKSHLLGIAAGIILVGALYFFLSAGKKQRTYDPDQFEFSANKVISKGVPNSVIFNYTARVRPDSLFIVQTWDIRRKTLVESDKHEHSAIYYYPGFFRTKLIADEQVVKSHDLQIASDGWLCLLEQEPVPIYFNKNETVRDSVVEVDEAMLAKHHPLSVSPRVRFFNQRDLGDLTNDNFTFETTVRNTWDDGANACHYTEILIQCKDDIIIIPLAATPCVGNLALYFCGTLVESKSADLSGFGCDLNQWNRLRVESVDKNVTIYVNNSKAYSLSFPNRPTGIVGVQYRFNGAAAVKETQFTSKGKVYQMD